MKYSFLFAAFAYLPSFTSASLQFVTPDGLCRPKGTITAEVKGAEDESIGMVDIIDCTASEDISTINKVFDTNFLKVYGVNCEKTDNGLILLSSFEKMFSDSFCGSKAIDYNCLLPGKLCIAMNDFDINNSLKGYNQIIRRIINYVDKSQAKGNLKNPLVVTFLIDKTDTNSNEISNTIREYFNTIWEEFTHQSSLESSIDLKVVTVDSSDEASLAKTKDSIVSDAPKVKINELPSLFIEKWSEIPTKAPAAVLSPSERNSLYSIEVAFATGMKQAEITLNQWQSRVANGKIIGKFADRVENLQKSVKKDFIKKTTGTSLLRERNERWSQLSAYITKTVKRLFDQQISILEYQITSKFRTKLQKLASSFEIDSSDFINGQEQLLRHATFDFKAMVSELEIELIGCVLKTEDSNKFSSLLQTITSDFPDSPAAKLEEIKKIERMALQKPKSSKRGKRGKKKFSLGKALGISLGLVGMLRPPGYGNLQGFIGYATGFLGLPLDLLLGVQNDGDAAEVLGEDREQPLLRLQPKLNFDIDL